jgi:hypothetical protein
MSLYPLSATGAFTFIGQAASGVFAGPTVPTYSPISRYVSVVSGMGSGVVRGVSGDQGNLFYHPFSLGNEVRTVIPEPGTGTLFGLGLVGLGAAATRLRRRRPA